MKLNLSFRWKVFLFYSFFVTILVTALVVSFYIYVNSILTQNALGNMEESVKRVSSQLDTLVENMDNISNLILLNKDLQYILLDSLDFNKPNTNYFDYNPSQKYKVNEIFLSIIGVKNPPRRTCIFNQAQNYVSFSTLARVYELRKTNSQSPCSIRSLGTWFCITQQPDTCPNPSSLQY